MFFFDHTLIAPNLWMVPECAPEIVQNRLDADHFQTLRMRTRGEVSPEELRAVERQAREAAAAFFGVNQPKSTKGRSLYQGDKVAILAKGREWYRYLSEHFTHGRVTDREGLSWQGGVMSMDKVEDQFAFLGLMDYLVNQVALMNSYAALCPVTEDSDRWTQPTLAQLQDIRVSSKALRDAAKSARYDDKMGTLEPIGMQRALCERHRDGLRNLTKIHIEIDAPWRMPEADELDWVFRLCKVSLHAVAIAKCEVSADGLHVMTTELRAAYEQMDVIWKCLTEDFRFDKDGSWWANEAKNGLAAYNHPTMTSLAFPLAGVVSAMPRPQKAIYESPCGWVV